VQQLLNPQYDPTRGHPPQMRFLLGVLSNRLTAAKEPRTGHLICESQVRYNVNTWLPNSQGERDEKSNGCLRGRSMPVISRFFGVVIAMYWRDHAPPHFHAKYGDDEVTVDIQTGKINGVMSRRALTMIEEWRVLHLEELLENWQFAGTRQSLRRIAPLE
jgi:hypothetical protein